MQMIFGTEPLQESRQKNSDDSFLRGIATGRMFRTDSMSLGGNCTKQITVWGGWVFWDDLCNSLLLRKWRAKSFLDKQFRSIHIIVKGESSQDPTRKTIPIVETTKALNIEEV